MSVLKNYYDVFVIVRRWGDPGEHACKVHSWRQTLNGGGVIRGNLKILEQKSILDQFTIGKNHR